MFIEMFPQAIKRLNIEAIGIMLVSIGVPLGMYLNFSTGTNIWSPLIMFLSIAFILHKKRLSFYIKTEYISLFIFQLIMICYCLWSSQISIQYLFFHLYIIALILALSKTKNIEMKDVLRYSFFFSIPLTVFGIIVCQLGLVVGPLAWSLRNANEDYALEPFTISLGSLIGYFSGLCITKKNRFEKILVFIILGLNIYLIWQCQKRTPLLILIICTLIYHIKSKGFTPQTIIPLILKLIPISIITLLILLQNQEFYQEFNKFSTNVLNGIQNILGNNKVSDSSGSAIVRYEYRTYALDYIKNQFNIINYIYGNGYMEKWKQIDNPILQAYLDMGIIGLLGYINFVIIYPIRKLLFHKLNVYQLFFLFCSLYNVFSSISSGNPYFYQKYTPICLLILSFTINKKQTS